MHISFKLLPVLVCCVLALPVKSQQKNTMSTTLSPKQNNLITISSYTAQGDLTKLKPALNAGLDAGVTVNEIRESLVHLYAYCGFPRSLRGLMTFMEVLEERKAKGITDKIGSQASPIIDKRDKYTRGKETLEELSGVKESGPKTGYAAFAPEIEVFLKEHLFADLFERDVLTYQERELVTVSVLSSIGGVEPMLSSHLGLCLNVGITAAQLQEFMAVIKTTVNLKDAATAETVLAEVLAKKK
jgi:4-carboxymuconolactone decarboxylase